jgi:hypothetical protein
MKSPVLLLPAVIVLVCAATLVAATPSHVIVLGEDSPASDAIAGANFAASAKASTQATYTSMLDSEAYETYNDAQARELSIVVIDGKTARTNDRTAKAYFEDQGFAVVSIEDREDLLVTFQPVLVDGDGADDAAEDSASDDATDDATAETTTAEDTPAPVLIAESENAPIEPVVVPVETPAADDAVVDNAPPTAETPRPSAWGRFVGWFKRLF